MNSKGLSREVIVKEAINYIRESNQEIISLHEIARRLGIKTPSLYNHIKSNKELQYDVFKYAINLFVDNQKEAIKGLKKDDAIKAFSNAYYNFAKENKGLYKLIMSIPSKDDEYAKEIALPLLNIVVEILKEYELTDFEIAHWQRVFRAILHGFISEEELGYFYFYDDISLYDSQNLAIQCFLDGIKARKH